MRDILLHVVLLLAVLLFGGCSPFPPPSTGIVSSMKVENECFDLTAGRIDPYYSCRENFGQTLWDFAILNGDPKSPPMRLYLNPGLDVKAAFPTKDYASLTLSDALTATFSAQVKDQLFQVAIIQTSLHNYYKVHVLWVKLNTVWFEWEQLK